MHTHTHTLYFELVTIDRRSFWTHTKDLLDFACVALCVTIRRVAWAAIDESQRIIQLGGLQSCLKEGIVSSPGNAYHSPSYS